MYPAGVTAMSDATETNGSTATMPSRIGEADVKSKPKRKTAPKSKFREGFEFLRDAEYGSKAKVSLVRKTEEGNLSLSIKGFPATPDVDGVKDVATEVGLSAGLKSSIGEADATFSKSLAGEEAEAFVEIVTG
jgi:hypothetical protein